MKKTRLNIIKEFSSSKINASNEEFIVKILKGGDGYIQIERTALRSKIKNQIDTYTFVSKNKEEIIRPLDVLTAETIIDRLSNNTHKWSDAFIFNEVIGSKLEWKNLRKNTNLLQQALSSGGIENRWSSLSLVDLRQ